MRRNEPEQEQNERKKLLLQFTGCYEDQTFYRGNDFVRFDLRDQRGTDSYLDELAEEEILKKIRPYGAGGIHFFDSGNYHYMSRLFTGLIEEDFILVDFDHHTDMQIPAFGSDILSCGSWLRHALDEEPHLKKVVLIGPPENMIAETAQDLIERYGDRIVTVSEEEIADWQKNEPVAHALQVRKEASSESMAKEVHTVIQKLEQVFTQSDLPVYFSVDKDVFDVNISPTNWDQGILTMNRFWEIMNRAAGFDVRIGKDAAAERTAEKAAGKGEGSEIAESAESVVFAETAYEKMPPVDRKSNKRRVIGMDVCGEFPPEAGGDEAAAEKNDAVNRVLAGLRLFGI